jgi:hypothetical protein
MNKREEQQAGGQRQGRRALHACDAAACTPPAPTASVTMAMMRSVGILLFSMLGEKKGARRQQTGTGML